MSKAATANKEASASQSSPTTVTSDSGVTFKRPGAGSGDSNISYVRLGALSEGDTVVEGIYMGSSANFTYPEKLDFKFKKADDSTVIVNEGGNLKSRLKDITPGTLVLITYKGMQKITKGVRAGKMAHNVELYIAD